jgi:tripartite-type tricarboxylate transporter receptor subunit TctC
MIFLERLSLMLNAHRALHKIQALVSWLSLTLALLLITLGAQAQQQPAIFPSKLVRIIVPYAPGGITDRLARLVGQKLSLAWGQQVLVENRPGAATLLGTQFVIKAAPDGHTLLWGGIANTVAPALFKDLPYDPVKDLAWVTNIIKVPLLLATHPSLPVNNAQQLIVLAKRQPQLLVFATSGVGTSGHLAGELLNTMANIRILHIPYKGAAQAIIDTLSGQVPIYFGAIASPIQHVKTGRLRAIAVTSLKRLIATPEIPTLDEQGLRGFETATWYGVAAPPATPKEVVQKINADIVRITRLPEVRAGLEGEGAEFVGDSPDQVTAFVVGEIAKWAKVVKQAGVKPE